MGHTDYLFSTPNYLSGIASIFDIGGVLTQYDYSSTPEEADRKAIEHDFMAVGEDMKKALNIYTNNG